MATERTDSRMEIDPDTGFVKEVHGTSAGPAEGASLTQLREILVGPASRDLEQRLARIEERLDRTILELTEDASKRIDAIQAQLRDGLDRMGEDVARQGEQQSGQIKQLKRSLESAVRDLEKKATELTEQMAAARDALRSELVDRPTLSSLLSEVAMRIAGPPAGGPGEGDVDLEGLIDARTNLSTL